MNTIRQMVKASILGCLVTLGTAAEIVVESDELVKTAELGQADVVYQFTLRNTGKEAVKITSVSESCPCVKVVDSPKVIPANGTAEVSAVFNPNPVGGPQTQHIAVKIDGQEKPIVLKLKLTMPVVAEVEPKFLFWRKGGEAEERKVILNIPASPGAKVLDVYAMDENFRTRTTMLENGLREITVTPVSMEVTRPAMVMVELEVEGRSQPLRIAIPCNIADTNPFELQIRPQLREMKADPAALERSLKKSPATEPPPVTSGKGGVEPEAR